MPKKWNKSLTYKPKIAAVRAGECRQTIRPKHTVNAGDWINIYGWSGRPYHSSWGWKTGYMLVKAVRYIWMYADGTFLQHYFNGNMMMRACRQDWSDLDDVARDDGIVPPTGDALGELMTSLYPLPRIDDGVLGKPMQIIKWMRFNHQSDFWGPGGSYK